MLGYEADGEEAEPLIEREMVAAADDDDLIGIVVAEAADKIEQGGIWFGSVGPIVEGYEGAIVIEQNEPVACEAVLDLDLLELGGIEVTGEGSADGCLYFFKGIHKGIGPLKNIGVDTSAGNYTGDKNVYTFDIISRVHTSVAIEHICAVSQYLSIFLYMKN